jgi:hypothetical protein
MSAARPRFLSAVNWKHAVGEFVLIVAGVIVALAATAWWDGRQDRRRERDYLLQLLEDTRENERRLNTAIEEDASRREMVGAIVRALMPARPLPPADSLRFWWSQGPLGFSDPRLVLGTLRALIESGDFRLVGDSQLRLALLAYREEVEGDLRALERLEQQQGATTSRILERIEPIRVMDDSANFGLDFPATAPALRQDPLARSTARDLWRIHSSRVYYLNRMAEQTRALRQTLLAELKR